jgi:hypothetical protein
MRAARRSHAPARSAQCVFHVKRDKSTPVSTGGPDRPASLQSIRRSHASERGRTRHVGLQRITAPAQVQARKFRVGVRMRTPTSTSVHEAVRHVGRQVGEHCPRGTEPGVVGCANDANIRRNSSSGSAVAPGVSRGRTDSNVSRETALQEGLEVPRDCRRQMSGNRSQVTVHPRSELAPNTSERKLQVISNSELSVPAHDSFSTRRVRTSRED